MFCSYCGSQLVVGGRFCGKCGRSTASLPVQIVPLPIQTVTATNPKEGKNLQIWGILIFLFSLILEMPTCGLGMMRTEDNDWLHPVAHTLAILGFLPVLIGIVTYYVGKATHWYHAE